MRLPNAAHILHSLEVARRGRAAAPERPSRSSQEVGPPARVAGCHHARSRQSVGFLSLRAYGKAYVFYCRSPLFYTRSSFCCSSAP